MMKIFQLEMLIFVRSLRPHPNCVLFLGITTPPDPVCIITEFVERGSLETLLLSKEEISPDVKLKIVKGIALGMFHLHSENIIHRDLASRNVLVQK